MDIRNKKAFSFTEVIIAALIVTILSAGMFAAFISSQYFVNRARHKMQAYNFAKEALDALRCNYQYTDSQMSVGNGHLESEIGSIIRGEMSNLSASLTYDVTEPQADGYKQVTVHVQWTEKTL